MKNTRFAIDDEVRLKSSYTTIGIIKQIVSVLANENTLYLVEFPHGLKMVSEKELELNREIVQVMDDVNLSDLSIAIEVDDKIQQIINELNLVASIDPSEILVNACKLQRYLILTNSVIKKYTGARSNNILVNSLYNGLIIGDRNYLTNALIFKEIMRKLNANVHCVAMMDKMGKFYVSNLVLINDKYYYFDVTLDLEIYLSSEDEELELCCAGLGRKKYEKYFRPVSLLEFDTTVPNNPVPDNISIDDIDAAIIRGIK